ncbi:hypothetical protein SAMN04489756_1345 [Cloacibacterium normanense]|nr:hypothetical protein SAMN04489756_1345 [Cloacibacterium normanense]
MRLKITQIYKKDLGVNFYPYSLVSVTDNGKGLCEVRATAN